MPTNNQEIFLLLQRERAIEEARQNAQRKKVLVLSQKTKDYFAKVVRLIREKQAIDLYTKSVNKDIHAYEIFYRDPNKHISMDKDQDINLEHIINKMFNSSAIFNSSERKKKIEHALKNLEKAINIIDRAAYQKMLVSLPKGGGMSFTCRSFFKAGSSHQKEITLENIIELYKDNIAIPVWQQEQFSPLRYTAIAASAIAPAVLNYLIVTAVILIPLIIACTTLANALLYWELTYQEARDEYKLLESLEKNVNALNQAGTSLVYEDTINSKVSTQPVSSLLYPENFEPDAVDDELVQFREYRL